VAVLCEGISVVIRVERLLAVFPTFDDFREVVPNRTLAADNELARVGFMTPDDVRGFIELLEEFGLHYVSAGAAQDMIVVDQISGPAARCNWIEFGHVTIDGHRIAAARLAGSQSRQLITPDEWTFERSLSRSYCFVPKGGEKESLKFLRSEGGLDVYLSLLTGKEVYVGRTGRR
jgi:hypothetical protein